MQFGLTSPSLVERKRDERATHGALATLLEVMRKVHGRFFEEKVRGEEEEREGVREENERDVCSKEMRCKVA